MDWLKDMFRGSLGPVGNAILDFYIANALWMNFLVGGYFVVLIIARRRFNSTLNNLLVQVGYKTGEQVKPAQLWALAKLIQNNKVNWQEAIALDKFPFIAMAQDYYFLPKTEKTLRKFFSLENVESMAKLLEHRLGKVSKKGKNAS